MKEAFEKLGITEKDIEAMDFDPKTMVDAKEEESYIHKVVNDVITKCKEDESHDIMVMGRMMLCGLGFLKAYIAMMESMEKKEPDVFHRLMNNPRVQMTINEVSKTHIELKQLLNRAEVI